MNVNASPYRNAAAAATLVGAINACGGVISKGGEPPTPGDASSVVSPNDAGVLACKAASISGLQVYNEMATAAGPSGTCGGAVQSAAAQGLVWQSSAPGMTCASSVDCAPTCCACAASGTSVVASWCNSFGTCATAEETCCALVGTFSESCGNCMPGPSCGNK